VQTKQEVSKKVVVLESMCVCVCACVGGRGIFADSFMNKYRIEVDGHYRYSRLTVIIDTVVDGSITKNGL